MLAIKLKRIGKKHQPSFRVIVAEKRSKLQGRFVDDLGWLNPATKEFKLNQERVNYWLKNGAQPTDSVYNLLIRGKIISGPKRPVHKKSKKTQKDAAGQLTETPKKEVKKEIKEEANEEAKEEAKKEEVKETEEGGAEGRAETDSQNNAVDKQE